MMYIFCTLKQGTIMTNKEVARLIFSDPTYYRWLNHAGVFADWECTDIESLIPCSISISLPIDEFRFWIGINRQITKIKST